MNRFLARASQSILNILTIDEKTDLFLSRTHVQVSLSSRLWGI